jgi:hypothetical protein
MVFENNEDSRKTEKMGILILSNHKTPRSQIFELGI